VITPLAVLPPKQPPPAPPGGGGNPCAASDQFPQTSKGAAAVTRSYKFTNTGSGAWTIGSVVLEPSGHPEWSLDAAQLKGVLQPGESKVFTVTFTPPAK